MEVAKVQDMPPPGGYKPINFRRVPAKTFFSGWAILGGYLGMTAGAAYVYFLTCKSVHKEDIEMRSANFAVYPMLLAERDREYLKQLRRNRNEEADLMKNVEGWKVGTWYGEAVYPSDPNKFVEPRIQDYYIHANGKELSKRTNVVLLS